MLILFLSIVISISLGGFCAVVTSRRPEPTERARKTVVAKHHERRCRMERLEHQCLDPEFLRTIRDEGFIDHHKGCSGCRDLEREDERRRLAEMDVDDYLWEMRFSRSTMAGFYSGRIRIQSADECPECQHSLWAIRNAA